MAKSPLQGRAGKALAENYGAKAGEPWDKEDEELRAEFAGLDLTDEELADLHEAWRLRRRGATNSEQIGSRQMFAAVRRSLALAVKATLDHETGIDRAMATIANFEIEEAAEERRIMARHSPDHAPVYLAALIESRDRRRRDRLAGLGPLGEISTMARNDAFRMHSRDGLAWLEDKRKINLRQAIAGRSYRRRWEAGFRGLRSTLAGEGGRANPGQIVAAQERASLWHVQRARCDTAIVLRLRQHPEALNLTRRVAGEGSALTSVTGNGRSFESGLKVLVMALNVVADLLPYEDG